MLFSLWVSLNDGNKGKCKTSLGFSIVFIQGMETAFEWRIGLTLFKSYGQKLASSLILVFYVKNQCIQIASVKSHEKYERLYTCKCIYLYVQCVSLKCVSLQVNR